MLCRPVPGQQAEALSARGPELTLRAERANWEAFVKLAAYRQIGAAEWQLVSQSLLTWGAENEGHPTDLGARTTHLFGESAQDAAGHDCQFALPDNGRSRG